MLSSVNAKNVSSKAFASLLSFAFALVFTFLSLNLFLKVIRKKKLDYFAYYCFVVGLLLLINEILNHFRMAGSKALSLI